ncbi:MAG: COX15/CtaA family protein [Actinomycetota bacterium]|jgi:cytochrome c oxidase assembly protein subunit 15
MNPNTYRKTCVVVLAALFVIVVTGAAVRLSGSGLGCADWPNCNASKFVDVSTVHGAIEQINRLFTGLVMVLVIVAVMGALRRRPRRRDLTVLAALIALGVPMQGVVGAIVVLTKLNPFANQQHFLLSMVLVALGAVLVRRAGEPDHAPRITAVSDRTRGGVRVVGGLTALALVTGTFVTGAGPHAGDETAKRFHVAISSVARVHGITVMCAIAAAIVLLWRLRSEHADRAVLDNALTTWMVLAVAQAAVGYTQYFTGVPVVLVAIHVAFATGLWLATVQLWLSTSSAIAIPDLDNRLASTTSV